MPQILEKPAGPRTAGVTTVTSGPQYTVINTDKTVLVNDTTAGEAVRVILPAAFTSNNRELTIKKVGSDFAVTVDGNGAETIDGATTQVISIQYDAMQIKCDGTEWHII